VSPERSGGEPASSDVSVLIATYRRPRLLGRCLDHLAAQTGAPPFEVVVAVDGDDDYAAAELERRAAQAPFALRVSRAPHHGQAAALNRALGLARGRLALVLGDDILAAPDLVARHAGRHAALDDPLVAVQGRVSWHPELLPDPFLEWEERAGLLFAFDRMEPHAFVPLRFLYTCNVSLPRDTLRELGGFDDTLSCWIDTVFAFRAEGRGLRLYYEPDAAGHHLDRWTMERVCRRRREKGRISTALAASDPGFASFVTLPRPGPWRTVRYGLSRLLFPAVEKLGWRRTADWCRIHEANRAFTRGVEDGRRELAAGRLVPGDRATWFESGGRARGSGERSR
jgi:glycosyltransferase involved in cell wall biosynthesis